MRRTDRGQATVEFALILPLVIVVLLGVIQVAAVTYAQLEVSHAAREAVRSIAVDPSVDVAELERQLGSSLSVSVAPGSDRSQGRELVQVVATQDITPISPLFAPFLDGVQVQAIARMASE